MKLDSVTVVPFPDSAAFGVMHEKFFETLVNSLNHAYSFADREDAVEEAFYKLMFKKDRDTYEKEPETEKDWFYALRWQARAALSHRRENAECHARYVEEAAKALADVFVCGRGVYGCRHPCSCARSRPRDLPQGAGYIPPRP